MDVDANDDFEDDHDPEGDVDGQGDNGTDLEDDNDDNEDPPSLREDFEVSDDEDDRNAMQLIQRRQQAPPSGRRGISDTQIDPALLPPAKRLRYAPIDNNSEDDPLQVRSLLFCSLYSC